MGRFFPVAERGVHAQKNDVAGLRICEDATEREPGEGVKKAARHTQETRDQKRLLRRIGTGLCSGRQFQRCGFHGHRRYLVRISSRRAAAHFPAGRCDADG